MTPPAGMSGEMSQAFLSRVEQPAGAGLAPQIAYISGSSRQQERASVARLPIADTMKRFVAEVTKLPSGSLIPQFYCADESGINRSVTETLLDLVSESSAKALAELEALVELSERGGYKPSNPDLPDWSVNEKYVWFHPQWQARALSASQTSTVVNTHTPKVGRNTSPTISSIMLSDIGVSFLRFSRSVEARVSSANQSR